MEKVKKYANRIFIDGLSGMAQGLFATLLVGTILEQIGLLIGGSLGGYIIVVATIAKKLTGAGIGIGVASKFREPPLVTVSAATAGMIGAYAKTAPYLGGCGLHDPLAAAVALDSTLVTCLAINMKVDTEGATRGRTIGDETRLNDAKKTMKVAVAVDTERFLAQFMERITKLLAAA